MLSLFPMTLIIAQLTDFWLWKFLGRLHPLIVHFPIGLLVVALMLELFTLNKKNHNLRPGINLLLIIGALSSVAAVVFGLFLKTQDEYSGDLITIHQWSGIATAILAIATMMLHARITGQHKSNLLKVYRVVLIFTVVSLTIAGHYGASLTHGADFLTSTLPWNNANRKSGFDVAQFTRDESGTVMKADQIAALNLEVRSIFAHNCYKCHSSEKMKGGLRLDKKVFVMKGGESGDVISAGHPEESEMIRRLELPREDEESMPPKGKTLTEKEIVTLKLWIELGAPWPEDADEKSVYRVAKLDPRLPPLPEARAKFANPVDLFVNAYFEEKKIDWPQLVSDRIYIRRVYLDIIGLLPPPEKVDAFVAEIDPQKRVRLVEELLQRNDDYAQHWLTFWNDVLRNDYSGTGYITGGRFQITEWLYDGLTKNKPYDVFVRELISPNKKSEGFIRGIEWRGTVNASQRVEMQAAQNISQVFLGLNLKCASCHDSFVSDWTLKQAYDFANIFSDTTLEI
ncbi:MAG TPA: DUF1549 domain-containing protein, partial [Chryseolinea sp.]|nr:DUF1549 domain-containing protein [Chryseolinea sp.]